MLCKRNCNRLFLYPVIIWAYLELFCEVSANISSMNKSLQPWRLKCFNLSTMKFKKKNVCVPTCPHLYFCCCCHWCLLVLHNIFEYDKRYIIIIYHQVCSFCIYIQWLPFAKEKKRPSEPMLYKNNIPFRPICWFLQPQPHMAFVCNDLFDWTM